MTKAPNVTEARDRVSIALLRAGNGDAIWIAYGPHGHMRRIIVDGGPAPSYEDVGGNR